MPHAATSIVLLLLGAACQPDATAIGRGPGDRDDPPAIADTEPPRVILTEPATPAVLEGDHLVIAGRVEDESPDRVEIDGVRVDLREDGTFTTMIPVEPGAVRARVRAFDTAGHAGETFAAALVGPQRPSGTPVEDAAVLGLGPGAFSQLTAAAQDRVAGADLGGLLTSAGPVATGSWGELTVTGLTHGGVTVALAPGEGVVEGTVTVVEPWVDLELDPPFFGPIDGHLAADELHLTVALALGAVDGRATVVDVASTAELVGFHYNVDNFPGFLESLVRDRVRTFVEQRIAMTVESTLRSFLEEALASVPASFEAPILGAPIEVSAAVSAIDVTPEGAHLVVDLAAAAQAPLREREAIGYLAAPEGVRPEAMEHEVELDLALQSLNAIMSELWRGGAHIERFRTPPTAAEVAFLVPEWRDEAPPDAAIEVVLDFALPPVIVAGPDGLRLETADLRIEVIAVAGGEDIPLGVVSAAVSADVDAALETADGAPVVHLDMGEMRVSGDALSGLDGVSAQRIGDILAGIAPPVADFLERFLSIGAPALPGFRLDAESGGARDGYVHFGGRITFDGTAP